MKITHLITVVGIVVSLTVSAEMNHATMDHSQMSNHSQMGDNQMTTSQTKLTESGTDAFATLQEVITILNADTNTNWKNVNLEALRQHLAQMQDMTLNVSVVQHNIKNGFKAVITPTTNRAKTSLAKVLSAHPAQMQKETGWKMQVVNKNNIFTITVTTENISEVDKIRGLGYIGLMAYGNHHQPHHWSMATGINPHAGGHSH